MNHGDLHYFVLRTPDLAASSRFFADLLGWQLDNGELTNTRFRGALSDAHDRALWAHVDDCEAAVAKVAELGGQPGEITHSRSGASASCSDDQGNVFHLGTLLPEFQNWDHPPRQPIGELSYATFAVGDTAKAVHFHSQLFGWEFTEPGEAGVQSDYRHCTNGSMEFGFTSGGHGGPSLYFEVSDADAIADTVTSLGGTPGTLITSASGLTLSDCADPAGVSFHLWQRPAS